MDQSAETEPLLSETEGQAQQQTPISPVELQEPKQETLYIEIRIAIAVIQIILATGMLFVSILDRSENICDNPRYPEYRQCEYLSAKYIVYHDIMAVTAIPAAILNVFLKSRHYISGLVILLSVLLMMFIAPEGGMDFAKFILLQPLDKIMVVCLVFLLLSFIPVFSIARGFIEVVLTPIAAFVNIVYHSAQDSITDTLDQITAPEPGKVSIIVLVPFKSWLNDDLNSSLVIGQAAISFGLILMFATGQISDCRTSDPAIYLIILTGLNIMQVLASLIHPQYKRIQKNMAVKVGVVIYFVTSIALLVTGFALLSVITVIVLFVAWYQLQIVFGRLQCQGILVVDESELDA